MIIKIENFTVDLSRVGGDVSEWLDIHHPEKKEKVLAKAKDFGYEITPIERKDKEAESIDNLEPINNARDIGINKAKSQRTTKRG